MGVKIWKNTSTLDGLTPFVRACVDPAEAEVAVVGGKPVDLNAMPNLRAIFKCGVGTDNIPFDECARRGVSVWLPREETCEIIYEETANYAVYLIMRLLYLEVGEWDRWKKFERPFLGKRRVLIVGEGNIGSRVGKKLQALVEVTTFDAARQAQTELQTLVEEADVVSLHVPLIDSTRGFWNAEKLGWMKDGAGIVNTSRGAVMDESALLAELQRGRLRAALDVFSVEPYSGPLSALPETVLVKSPHVASTCQDFLQGLARDLEHYLAS